MCLTQPLVLGQPSFNGQAVGRGFSRSLQYLKQAPESSCQAIIDKPTPMLVG
jgi:hypothetical protein